MDTIDLSDGTDAVNFNTNVFGVTVANAENINGSSNFDSVTLGSTTVTAGLGADALGLEPGVDIGSRQENASNQKSRAPFRFNRY